MHDSETFQCSKIPITNAWCTENFLTLILHVKVLSSTQHKICHYGAVQDPVNFQSSNEETKSNTIIAHIHQKYKKNPITHNKHQVLSHITKWPNSYSPKTTRHNFHTVKFFCEQNCAGFIRLYSLHGTTVTANKILLNSYLHSVVNTQFSWVVGLDFITYSK